MFGNITYLVLVDILEHLVSMARLGHERLRQACFLKWVTDRMTDVTFETIVRAHQTGGDVAAAFCTNAVMKRLKGRITVTEHVCRNAHYMDACIELAMQVPGRIHLKPITAKCPDREIRNQYHEFVSDITEQINPCYFSEIRNKFSISCMIIASPAMVFEYAHDSDVEYNYVYYRPALLKGRHIVDALRAVCRPADVDKAELDRVKRETTEDAEDMSWEGEEWEGVWITSWQGTAVTAEALAV